MVKYEIKIRITSKDYFDMTARYLPFQIVGIEELVDLPMPKAPPAVVALVEKLKTKKKRRRSHGIDLKSGVNRVLVDVLADGKRHRAAEMKEPVAEKGFSRNSVGSRLQNLAKHGIARQIGDGTWELANVPNTEKTNGIEGTADQLHNTGV